MNVKLILPAPGEARAHLRGTIKYSLFPPLGLALLAAYLPDEDDVSIEDDHTERLHLDDSPDLVGIEVYVSAAHRAYELADHYRRRGIHVVLGGLHATACPDEAAQHADTVVTGPAEEAWPRFLADFRARRPKQLYRSEYRELDTVPLPRRDLIARNHYLVP
ncbi:MAG: hypothetical protein HN742_02300 [Lentisphaerae bacterium]|nr:hypothetical protein [Lentisphaerota bacterium]MBT7840669.1 hypothetical protein [Lentisphaerota bacterium]